ncbi:hypothetical protein V6070_25870, partial [Klebsiella pneumoniae]
LHGDVLMWLMKTLLTSGCTNQRGAGHACLLMEDLIKQLFDKVTDFSHIALMLQTSYGRNRGER